jgi:hypothetical protein
MNFLLYSASALGWPNSKYRTNANASALAATSKEQRADNVK